MEATAVMTDAFGMYDQLYGYALRLTRNPDDAADLVGDVIERAGRNADRFDGANLIGWLHTMMRNLFVNGYRARTRREARLGKVGSIDETRGHTWGDGMPSVRSQTITDRAATPVDDEAIADILDDRLAAALAALPTNWQTMIRIVDLEGRSYRDAAAECGVPIGSVMSGLSRARARLAEIVREVA